MIETVPDAVYTMGYSPAYVHAQDRWAQQPSLNFLVHHLIPGQRLLDVGCGGGWLSVRLAEAVAPGELVGIDFEQSQVDIARETAAERGLENARFQVADALELPFEEGSFDVVHLGGVLLHVGDAGRALREARRVLRPNGLLGTRDMMPDSCFVHPELGVMQRSFEVFIDLLAADGGNPSIARDIKGCLGRAGFTDVRVSYSFETYASPEELEFFRGVISQWFLGGGIADAAQEYGAMTEEMKLAMAHCLEEWHQDPGALAGMAFGQALAVRP